MTFPEYLIRNIKSSLFTLLAKTASRKMFRNVFPRRPAPLDIANHTANAANSCSVANRCTQSTKRDCNHQILCSNKSLENLTADFKLSSSVFFGSTFLTELPFAFVASSLSILATRNSSSESCNCCQNSTLKARSSSGPSS